jgi:anaerobic selenocysteine-containing dehydrogenase
LKFLSYRGTLSGTETEMTLIERDAVCTLDCPDTCSLTVTIDGDRIIKVRGSDALPYTEGVICNKVAHHTAAFVHGGSRIRSPLRRTGPRGSARFEPVSWEHALDEIHRRVTAVIDRFGPQAVMPLNYAGPHGMLAYDSMSLRFFHKLGATQLFRGSMCGAVRNEAWEGTYGAVPGISPEAAAKARLNVVWGNNATVTNLHLVRNIRAAKRLGGRLAVIDPLRTKIAEQADLHLAPRPSTDVLLGFALAVELERLGAHDCSFIAEHVSGYEEFMRLARAWPVERASQACGVPAADIRQLARWMAESDPLVIAPGNGLERGRNGGSGVRAAIALPALLGKLGAESGIVLCARFAFPKTPAKLTRTDLLPGGTRTLNILDVGRHLADDDLDPPLRAVFIYNHNPIVVHPEQNRMKRALLREDIFFVGIEVTMTESMQHCDVVLPAATHFECADLYPAYGHHWLQRGEPVIPPAGEALPNTEIFRRLAQRFGFQDACFSATDSDLMEDAVDGAHPRMQGVRPSRIPTQKALRMSAPDGRPLALFDNIMPATRSGRIELASDLLAERWGAPARVPGFRPRESAFPLALISPASDRRISSTLLGARASNDDASPLLMHPEDARRRGLEGAARVRVWNDLGSVVLPLVITDAIAPGVVASEKGAWLATSPTGQTISALVSADDRADLARGACYNDTRVEVERALA